MLTWSFAKYSFIYNLGITNYMYTLKHDSYLPDFEVLHHQAERCLHAGAVAVVIAGCSPSFIHATSLDDLAENVKVKTSSTSCFFRLTVS